MAAEKLITELDRLFTDCQQSVKRAVMAAVLSMLPVFFNNTEEIQDYINSLLLSFITALYIPKGEYTLLDLLK